MARTFAVEIATSPVPATFYGLRLWAIDGSEFTVPDTPAKLACFDKHRGDRGDGLTLTALVTHLETDFVSSKVSEHIPVPYVMRNLGSQDLLMVDRGLASFLLLLDCQARGIEQSLPAMQSAPSQKKLSSLRASLINGESGNARERLSAR